MIIDTDVFIWYMRGNKKAYAIIERQRVFFISVISLMELVQGMRNKKELTELRRSLRDWNAKVLYITEEISAKALFYMERHYLSHSLRIADALIGATAVVSGLPLLTGNDKHYRIIKEIDVRSFHP